MPVVGLRPDAGVDAAADTTAEAVVCTAVPMPQPPRLTVIIIAAAGIAAAGAEIKHLFKRKSFFASGAFACSDDIGEQFGLCDRARICELVHCKPRAK
jgi:hypothetical protein